MKNQVNLSPKEIDGCPDQRQVINYSNPAFMRVNETCSYWKKNQFYLNCGAKIFSQIHILRVIFHQILKNL